MSFKRFDPEDVVIGSEIVSTPTWVGASGEFSTLEEFYTSSKQIGGYTGQFYLDVYSTDPQQNTEYSIGGHRVDSGSASSAADHATNIEKTVVSLAENARVQFSIAYADKTGKGAAPYSLPISSEQDASLGNLTGKSPSSTIFGQYRSLVLGDEDSDFKFNGSEGDISENFFAITIDRARFKEKLIPGTLDLKFKLNATYNSFATNINAISSKKLPTALSTDSTGISGSADDFSKLQSSANGTSGSTSIVVSIRDDSSKNQSVQYLDSGRVYGLKAFLTISGSNFEDADSAPKSVARDILEAQPVLENCDDLILDGYSYITTGSSGEREAIPASKLNRWSFDSSCGFFLPDIGVILLDVKALRNLQILTQDPRDYASYVQYQVQGETAEFADTNVTSPMEILYNQFKSFTVMSQETVTSNYVFVRARNAEFNYSTNPSNITGSGELRHDVMINSPEAFITSVGLYNDEGDLLSVAKLSRPLPKSFQREALIRIKLDF